MQENLKHIKESALKELQAIKTADELEKVEIKYLGRKDGVLTELLKKIKDLSPEEKPTVGKMIQEVKVAFDQELAAVRKKLENESLNAKLHSDFYDITVPTNLDDKGSIHPIIQIQKQCEDIFSEMGFTIADGPEVESEYYNFEALNIPSWHPARDMQDTFFLEQQKHPEQGDLILRTHTSPVQIRTMLKYGAPLKIIVPGRVFRYESTDATHDSIFYQLEGLLIDEHINLSHLKGLMSEFLTRMFGQNEKIEVRFRPGYFPFVEPGLELDFLWKQPNGKSRWMEMMGAGMVHPNVLKAGGIDPNKYQGWAFGFGITRLALMKYQLSDIRPLHQNDLRFLKQL